MCNHAPTLYVLQRAAPLPLSVCSNPNDYVFWDDIHPTSRGHRIVTNSFVKVLLNNKLIQKSDLVQPKKYRRMVLEKDALDA